jgi:hypothetical protein
MFERPADTLAYFAGSFHRSDGDIFAGARGTLADRSGGIDRVQRYEIDSAFASTLRGISGALCGADANGARAGSDLSRRARLAVLFLL